MIKCYSCSRSPSGICVSKLANIANVSEQICRRYIRGDALPDYDKIITIANHLDISPGWLLFGEQETAIRFHTKSYIDEDLLHYILKKSHHLYKVEKDSNDYADFVLGLLRDIREIDTNKDNLMKIIDIAVSSISTYETKYYKHAFLSK